MSIGDKMMVKADGKSMNITVGSGRAWFDGTWNNIDTLYPIQITQSEVVLDRIDAVVLEVNHEEEVRNNAIKVIEGQPSSKSPAKPSLVKTDKVKQYPLAYVTVNRSVESLSQANIENTVGTSVCPFVTGILETMDIDDLVAQWQAQFGEWQQNEKNNFTAWRDTEKSDFSNWRDAQKGNFAKWFETMKDTLDGDVAGNLANDIYGLRGLYLDTTLRQSKWAEKKYSFEDEYPFAKYNLEVSPGTTCTSDQCIAWGAAKIVGSSTENVLTAIGDVPTMDIPIILKIVELR